MNLKLKVNTSNLDSGIYYVITKGNHYLQSKQFIKIE